MTTLEEYCNSFVEDSWDGLHQSSRDFLQRLGLPSVHPFCHDLDLAYSDIPPMGPLDYEIESSFGRLITWCYSDGLALISFANLWARLIAGFVSPIGVAWLLWTTVQMEGYTSTKMKQRRITYLSLAVNVTLASCMIFATDSMYVYEYGNCGLYQFLATILLAARLSRRVRLRDLKYSLGMAAILMILISWNAETKTFQLGEPVDTVVDIQPGLYYNRENPLIHKIVSKWPEEKRLYSRRNRHAKRPTPWLLTGDSRTGLPFFLDQPPIPKWTRVFLTLEDGEILALDVTFPEKGHEVSNPVYILLTGINGGTTEEYTRDLINRRSKAGSTVVTMIARGLMDLPIRGWDVFHGARWSDFAQAAKVVKAAIDPDQILAGVGFSMGGIILSNYVASVGPACDLDAAFAISGALDCRREARYERAKFMWETMIANHIRVAQHTGKWGKRMLSRLGQDEFIAMNRAHDLIQLDYYTAVKYYNYSRLDDFYSDMGTLGDVPDSVLRKGDPPYATYKIDNISIPLCLLHSFDDPIGTWKTVAGNSGFMHPNNLVKRGEGNLLLLLTASGGHVGWPLGLRPWLHNWEFMNEAAASFVDAVDQVHKSNR